MQPHEQADLTSAEVRKDGILEGTGDAVAMTDNVALADRPKGPAAEDAVPPTVLWLNATRDILPPLEGPAAVAERLLLLLHYGIDWREGWVGKHRRTYWEEILPSRVITSTYRCGTLRQWWTEISTMLESAPRTSAERADVVTLLGADSLPVLEVLRTEAEALVLRVRIVADHVRTQRSAQE